MNPEAIAGFLEHSGFRVVRTKSAWWYNEYRQDKIFYAFPQHRMIDPDEKEITQVFEGSGAAAVRFIAPAGTRGKESFLWVRRAPYAIETPEKKRRNLIRKGLERCSVRPVSWKELMSLGWESHRDTEERHGRKAEGLGLSENLENCPAYECWGSFVDNKLAAYAVTLAVEDWVHIVMGRSANAYLQHYPNDALIFSVTEKMLARPGVGAVSYGWESVNELGSLDHFKESLGFEKQPVSQRVVLNPSFGIFKSAAFLMAARGICLLVPTAKFKRLAGFLKIAGKS